MLRDGTLHLYLHLTVGRVDIVELLHTTRSEVFLVLCVKRFIEMEQFSMTA